MFVLTQINVGKHVRQLTDTEANVTCSEQYTVFNTWHCLSTQNKECRISEQSGCFRLEQLVIYNAALKKIKIFTLSIFLGNVKPCN